MAGHGTLLRIGCFTDRNFAAYRQVFGYSSSTMTNCPHPLEPSENRDLITNLALAAFGCLNCRHTLGQMNTMMLLKRLNKLAVPLITAAMITSMPASADAKNKFVAKRPGEVVFLRGLANIFSLGLDTLSDELKKYGVYSYVHNHKSWEQIGRQIIAKSKKGQLSYPIVIIGHSLGAGASPKLATMLGREGIAVQYMVMLDAVEPLPVTNYVGQAINYYLPKKDKDNLITPGADFEGEYQNINVLERLKGIDHFNIDENEILRGQMTKRIFELIETEEAELQ